MDCFLGLDFGTQGAKAMIADCRLQVLAQTYLPYRFAADEPGQAELPPQLLTDALGRLCGSLSAEHPALFHRVEALSVTGQMHGVVCLDRENCPVGSILLWCDTRSAAESRRLAAEWQDVNHCTAAYTAPKLFWLRENRPAQFAQIHRCCFVKDYLRYVLTGRFCTDFSDASGSFLYSFAAGGWDAARLAALGMRREQFPEILPSVAQAGEINEAGHRLTGLPTGLPVVNGAGDLAAALVGSGCLAGGDLLLNIGTAGQVISRIAQPDLQLRGRYFTFAFLDSRSYLALGSINASAFCLSWMMKNVLQMETSAAAFAKVEQLASTIPIGANGLVFLPYLMGTGSPYMLDDAAGGFYGLRAGHGTADLLRAVLEGVAFGVRDCADCFLREPGCRILLSGGGTRLGLWREIFAGAMGRDLQHVCQVDSSVMGAAALAMLGTGALTMEQVRERRWNATERICCSPAEAGAYRAAFAAYKDCQRRVLNCKTM